MKGDGDATNAKRSIMSSCITMTYVSRITWVPHLVVNTNMEKQHPTILTLLYLENLTEIKKRKCQSYKIIRTTSAQEQNLANLPTSNHTNP